MKLRSLPLAFILVALAMPPTARASPESLDFRNERNATAPDNTVMVLSRPQFNSDDFILTSTLKGIPFGTSDNTNTALTSNAIESDREVSPTSASTSIMQNRSGRHNAGRTRHDHAIEARSTRLAQLPPLNRDARQTLVDLGIVNLR